MAEQNYNRLVAQILGAVLVLVGLLGFVMPSPLLGIFAVDMIHNVIHLLTGAVLLGAAFMDGGRNVRLVNIVLGVVYLLVAALGFVAEGFLGTIIVANMADHLLHLLLGVVLLGVAFAMKGTTMMGSGTSKM